MWLPVSNSSFWHLITESRLEKKETVKHGINCHLSTDTFAKKIRKSSFKKCKFLPKNHVSRSFDLKTRARTGYNAVGS